MFDDLIKLIRGHRRQRVEEERVAPGLTARVQLLEHENRDLHLACEGLHDRERTLRRALMKLDERYQALQHGVEHVIVHVTGVHDANVRTALRELLDKAMDGLSSKEGS